MVVEAAVLLGVQHLQKGRRRISLVVAAHLVDLVQQHQRIFHACLAHSGRDAAGHGSHIGAPVSPDLRLVPDAAQGNAHILFVQRPGDGPGDGGLSRSGRPHQTDDRAPALFRQDPHSQELQHPLFDLFHAVVILIQDCLRPLQVRAVRGRLVPGKLQQRLDIAPEHGAFRGIVPDILEPADLLFNLFLYFLRSLQLRKLLPEMVGVGACGVFSQLLPDDF